MTNIDIATHVEYLWLNPGQNPPHAILAEWKKGDAAMQEEIMVQFQLHIEKHFSNYDIENASIAPTSYAVSYLFLPIHDAVTPELAAFMRETFVNRLADGVTQLETKGKLVDARRGVNIILGHFQRHPLEQPLTEKVREAVPVLCEKPQVVKEEPLPPRVPGYEQTIALLKAKQARRDSVFN